MTVVPSCNVTWNGVVMAFEAYAPVSVAQANRNVVRNFFILGLFIECLVLCVRLYLSSPCSLPRM